jgi:TetR/AcrR family transcriptional regulator, transcriptional repressor of bet genes
MARPKNTEERRVQIVDAFVRVLGREGFDAASVREIAREAELAPGLVHYHFKSKHEMLLALCERIEGTLVTRIGDKTSPHAIIEAVLGLNMHTDPGLARAWSSVALAAERHDDVRATYDRVLMLIRTSLEHAFGGAKPTRVHKDKALALVLAMEGAFRVALSSPTLIPRGDAARLVRILLEEKK